MVTLWDVEQPIAKLCIRADHDPVRVLNLLMEEKHLSVHGLQDTVAVLAVIKVHSIRANVMGRGWWNRLSVDLWNRGYLIEKTSIGENAKSNAEEDRILRGG